MELTVRENLVIYGRYFDLPRAEARRRADDLLEFVQLIDRGDEPGRAAVGRDEAPPDDRPVAHQRARADAPRRADDRPRPAGPAPRLGPPVPAQAARRHARPHDPLHGRGRAAVRPARRHGQGEDRRRGLARASSSSATRPARSPSSASRPASRRRSTASSTASPTGSSGCPTGSSCTPTTARRRSSRPTSAVSDPRPCSSGARRSRTCSCGSPAARSSSRRRLAMTAHVARGPRVRHGRVYRRTWRGRIVTTFLSPVLFLAALGFGLGRFVDSTGDADLGGVAVPAVPGARACSPRSAMQTGGFEATYPIIGGIRWNRIYPRDARDADHDQRHRQRRARAGSASAWRWSPAVFLLVMAPVRARLLAAGVARAPGRDADRPRIRGADHGLRRDPAERPGLHDALPLRAHAAVPLLSGTFFPIDQLPEPSAAVAWLSPRCGTASRLTRALTLGIRSTRSWPLLHVARPRLSSSSAAGSSPSSTFRRALVS